MKVAIVGSRNWRCDWRVREFVNLLKSDTELVSGGARGVDSEAYHAANAAGRRITVFQAEWHRLGKRAGFVRNQQIIDYSDAVVAFWDGMSPGTRDTIQRARDAGKHIIVFGETATRSDLFDAAEKLNEKEE